MASFRSQTAKLSFVMAYALTEASDPQVKDTFYIQLQAVLDGIPSSNMTTLFGDMSAKVGSRLRACRHLATFDPGTTYIYKCDILVSFMPHGVWLMKLTRRSHFLYVGCARVKSC